MNMDIQDFHEREGHYGLVLTERTQLFAANNPNRLTEDQLPAVDIGKLPESMGVRDWMQVENQGGQGSCQGHARSSAAELAYFRETGRTIQFNRQFAYITSQIVDGFTRDDGSTIEGGAAASKKYGEALESLWPYSGRYDRNIPKACYDDAVGRKLRTSMSLRSYDEVLRWIVNGIGGIVIGIAWNSSAEPDGDGRVTGYRSYGRSGHALALLDWNKKFLDTQGRPDIWLQNSWGKTWGVGGWASISPAVVQYWCDNETVIGYSDLDGPDIKPREFDYETGKVIA